MCVEFSVGEWDAAVDGTAAELSRSQSDERAEGVGVAVDVRESAVVGVPCPQTALRLHSLRRLAHSRLY